jgi:hypothetical protein
MSNQDKKRNSHEKPKDKKANTVNLFLTGIMASGAVSTAINANQFKEHNEALSNAKASLVENHTMVKNYKVDHKSEYDKATKAMLQRASDNLKKGNKTFAEQAPEEVPSSYAESETIIKQHIGQAEFGKIQSGVYTAGSASVTALAAMFKKLKGKPKNKKNKKD